MRGSHTHGFNNSHPHTAKLILVYPYVKDLRMVKLSVCLPVFVNRSARLEQVENTISRLGTFGNVSAQKGTKGKEIY
jgi:hypothetical protein